MLPPLFASYPSLDSLRIRKITRFERETIGSPSPAFFKDMSGPVKDTAGKVTITARADLLGPDLSLQLIVYFMMLEKPFGR